MDLISHKPHHTSVRWICFTFFVEASKRRQYEGEKSAIYRSFWLKVSAQRAMEYFQEVGEQETT